MQGVNSVAAKLHADHMTTQHHTTLVHLKNVFSFCYLVRGNLQAVVLLRCQVTSSQFYLYRTISQQMLSRDTLQIEQD